MGLFNKIFGSYNDRELKRIYPIADAIEKLEPEYAALTDDALRAKTDEFKARYNDGETLDELLPEAVRIVMDSGQASISMIQRRLRVGYARAARLIDIMEQQKIVSGFDGSKARKLLIDRAEFERRFGTGAAAASQSENETGESEVNTTDEET